MADRADHRAQPFQLLHEPLRVAVAAGAGQRQADEHAIRPVGVGGTGRLQGASTGNPRGMYGNRGTASSDNTPGGRYSTFAWIDAENRLKTGQLKALVATASLELGIDVGHIDLVCQIGSPRSIAFAPAALAATVAPLARWSAAIPPAWS